MSGKPPPLSPQGRRRWEHVTDHAKQHGENEKIIEYVSDLCSKKRQADIIADAKSIAPRTLGDFYERKQER